MAEPATAVREDQAQGLTRRRSSIGIFFRRLWRSKVGTIGFFMFATVVVLALLAPWLAPHDPNLVNLDKRFLPPAWEGGDPEHVLGTDQLGRDILSQLLYGARISLVISTLSVAGSFAIGTAVGLTAGYAGGIVDAVLMRVVDILQALPYLVVLLALVAVFGPSLHTIIIVFALTWWSSYARIVRGEVLSVRRREFVEAARSLGVSPLRLILRHVFPNVISAAMALAALALGSIIIAESALSYLGLGADLVTWGKMLAAGREYVVTAWWLAVFPGLAIVYTVLGVVFFGDWLRDYLDPRIRGR